MFCVKSNNAFSSEFDGQRRRKCVYNAFINSNTVLSDHHHHHIRLSSELSKRNLHNG